LEVKSRNGFVEQKGGDMDGVRDGGREGVEGEVELAQVLGEGGDDEADLLGGREGGLGGDATAEDGNCFGGVHVNVEGGEFDCTTIVLAADRAAVGAVGAGGGGGGLDLGREDSAGLDNDEATPSLPSEGVREGGVEGYSGVCGGIGSRGGSVRCVAGVVIAAAAAAGANGTLDEAQATFGFEDGVLGLLRGREGRSAAAAAAAAVGGTIQGRGRCRRRRRAELGTAGIQVLKDTLQKMEAALD